MKFLKLTGYYERHGLFGSAGVFETMEELHVDQIPQEVFLEKWNVPEFEENQPQPRLVQAVENNYDQNASTGGGHSPFF